MAAASTAWSCRWASPCRTWGSQRICRNGRGISEIECGDSFCQCPDCPDWKFQTGSASVVLSGHA
eukprot:15467264-Alexandrium_andersonii.AAC.1